MKHFVAILCLIQVVLSAPSEKTVVEQTQDNIAAVQKQASTAVASLNKKILEVAGVKNNEELLTTVQTQAQAFATQVKGVTDQINQQLSAQKSQVDGQTASITKQLSDTAADIISNNDPAKADQLKNSFGTILDQTNALNTQLQAQGSAAQAMFQDLLGKLYQQTLDSAKNFAQQLDAQAPAA